MSARILLVEDEVDLARTIAYALRKEGYVVTLAGTGREALQRAAEPPAFDLVVLDLMLPDLSGTEVCRQLRADPHNRDVLVLMLTARGEEIDRVVGFEVGADDYVVKPFSSAEVIARIRAVLRRAPAEDGEEQDDREAIDVRGLRIDPASRKVSLDGEELELSRKEFDLLAEIAYAGGDVVPRDELMSRVWDENWFGSTKTLDVHIGWLRKKLGDDASDPRWIETVRGVGFRLAGSGG